MEHNLALKELTEGAVTFSSFKNEIVSKDMPVFYNPKMRENRDLSIMMILYFLNFNKKKVRFAFPMSATGIRELRLLSEHKEKILEHSKNSEIELLINDINAESLRVSKENIERALNDNVKVKYVRSDARSFLIENKHFDYVEIDPFGTPIPFIDSALQSLKDNAIIGVTATDTSALTGTYPKVTYRKYGSKVVLSPSMHEVSIRILSANVIKRAAALGSGAELLFSYSDEHYVKIFFKIKKGKGRADSSLAFVDDINVCSNCGAFSKNDDDCVFCNIPYKKIGPLYVGSLWDDNVLKFINNLLEENNNNIFSNTLRKKVMQINEEKELSSIYNIRTDIHKLSSILKLNAVPKMDTIKEKIINSNHNFSRSIFSDKMIRTDMKSFDFKNMLLNIKDDNDDRL